MHGVSTASLYSRAKAAGIVDRRAIRNRRIGQSNHTICTRVLGQIEVVHVTVEKTLRIPQARMPINTGFR